MRRSRSGSRRWHASISNENSASVRIRASSRLRRAWSACLQDRLAGPEVVDLLRMGEDLLDPPELLDQPERPLRPDPRDAGDVIRDIPHEAENLHDLLRRDAEALLHGGDVVGLVLHRIGHDDVVGDELHQVLVTRDDDDLHPLSRLPAGDRPDDVVGLQPRLFEDRDVQPPDHLFDVGDLGDERVRNRPARGLVVGVGVVAEGGGLDVEGDGDAVRRLLAQELHQHRREAVDRVGGKPFRVGELPDRVKGPKQVVAPVDEDKFGAFLFFCHFMFAYSLIIAMITIAFKYSLKNIFRKVLTASGG